MSVLNVPNTKTHQTIKEYLEKNPDLFKQVFGTLYNNFYKKNIAFNFYNNDGSLKTKVKYIFKYGNNVLGPINILNVKKEYKDDTDGNGILFTLEEHKSVNKVKLTFVASNNVIGLNLNDFRVINSINNDKSIKKITIWLNNYPNLQIIKLDDTTKPLLVNDDSEGMSNEGYDVISDIVKIKKLLDNIWVREAYITTDDDITDITFLMTTYVLHFYKTQMRDACNVWLETIIKRTPSDEAYTLMDHIVETPYIKYDDDIHNVFEHFNITINDIPSNYKPCDYLPVGCNTEDIELANILQRIISLYNDII